MIRKKVLALCCMLVLFAPVSASAVKVGEKLPAFNELNMNGKPVDLNSIIGKKPVMLIFWSTWCTDCKKKLPEVNKLVKKYSEKGMAFIGINVGMNDTEKKALTYIKDMKMTYPVVFDKTGALSEKYRIKRVFAAIVAAKDGTVMMKYYTVPEITDDNFKVLQTYVRSGNKVESHVPEAGNGR